MHQLSIWRTLRDGRQTCVCGEKHPCVRYKEQQRRTRTVYASEVARRTRPIPAINPDMDQEPGR